MRPILALALLAGACGPGSGPGDESGPPRLSAEAGADALVWAAVQEALADCDRGTPGALLILAEVYDASALPELARRTYELVLARGAGQDEARVHALLAGVLERRGAAPEALAHLARAANLAPDNAPIHWRTGGLLLELGRLEEARAAFERALALEPFGVMQRLGLARLELLATRPQGALDLLEPLAERAPRVRFVHGLMARAWRALGREQEAARELRREARATQIGVLDPWAGRMQARATGLLPELQRADEELVAGAARTALERLERLGAAFADDPSVTRQRIRARLALGDAQGALNDVEAARLSTPDQFELELLFGRALLASADAPRALAALERATQLQPAFGEAWAQRGEIEFQLGRLAEAEASLLRALDNGGDDPRSRILLGQTRLLRAGQDPEALARVRTTFEDCCREFPRSGPAFAHLAEIQALTGDRAAARSSLDEARRLAPSYERLAEIEALLETQAAGR